MFRLEKYENGEIIRWAWSQDIDLIPEPFWTSIYLVDGLLIDSGPPAGLNDFKQFLESLDSESKVEKVIITHWHEDHSGGARYLSEELGVPVYMREEGVDKVKSGFSYPDYRKLAWGEPPEPAPRVRSIDFDSVTTKNEKYTFDFLHIPGHSVDLVALIESRQGWVFVSDSIVPKYQMVFAETKKDLKEGMEPVQDDMEQIHSSLKKLQRYTSDMNDFDVYTAAFGKFSGREIISKNIQNIEELHDEVYRYKEEGLENQEIVEELFGGEHPVGELTEHGLSRLNLVESLLEWPLSS